MCGIAGVINKNGQSSVYTGFHQQTILHKLENRGKEGAGISGYDGDNIHSYKDVGTAWRAISTSFLEQNHFIATIGQTRYSTAGKKISKVERESAQSESIKTRKERAKTLQPFITYTMRYNKIALAHNGNLTNASKLRKWLQGKGVSFETAVDTEVLLQLIRYAIDRLNYEMVEAIKFAVNKIEGTYSCLILVGDTIYAFRDPYGNRPLKIAETDHHYILASENQAWHFLQAKYLRKVRRGELVIISPKGISDLKLKNYKKFQPQKCSFEKTYLQSPSTTLHGSSNEAAGYRSVAEFRVHVGRALHDEHPIGAGIVIPIMQSGLYFSKGYSSKHSIANPGTSFHGIPIEKDDIAGRSFMEPSIRDREDAFDRKYYKLFETILPDIEYLLDNTPDNIWLICIDDSLIRALTSKKFVKMLREIIKNLLPDDFVRVKIAWLLGSPPSMHPCFYGIDTPNRNELIAANKTVPQIKKFIGVDYLGYISLVRYIQLHGPDAKNFCFACHNGKYKIPIIDDDMIKRRNQHTTLTALR